MGALPSELLSLVYAAATDNGKWEAFCGALNRYLAAPVMIYGHCTRSYESLGLMGAGFDDDGLDLYHDYYAPLNPWMNTNLALPVGDVGVSDATLPRTDLMKTEFYDGWLRPLENIVAGAAMICHRTEDRFVGLVAACPARHVDDSLPNVKTALQALSPHMMQSIGMSGALMDGAGRSMDHLAAVPQALFLIRRSGRTGYLNPAAETFLRRSGLLVMGHDGRLGATDGDLRRHIRKCMKAMCSAVFDAPLPPQRLRTEAFGTCILHAHPFPAEADHDFPESLWSDPVVGAFVISGTLGLEKGASFARLARSLDASNAEARLAEALMSGATLYEYADANGLSRHTVRNQMRALLHKTGTRNQADFLRHLHRLSSPFTDPAL